MTHHHFLNALKPITAIIGAGFLFCSLPGPAQVKIQKDLGDIVSSKPVSLSLEPEIGRLYLPILPIIGYAPANGFIVGAGIAGSLLVDSASHTHISSAMANVQLTSKDQVNINLRHNVYLTHDQIVLQGDWRLLLFSQPTYGLGIFDFPPVFAFNDVGWDETSGAQPMKFNYLRIYETIFFKVAGRLYGGTGLSIDHLYQIQDELLNLDSEPKFFTSHYIYSIANGFLPTRYSMSGLTFKLMFDNRDNSINTYRGRYANAGIRFNPTWLGSSQSSSQLLIETKSYFRTGKGTNIFALWAVASLQLSGNVPYLALPSIGWDTYNRSGRGYIQGRFRGQNLMYVESEYRFKISANGFLGGVIFLNATTTDSPLVGQYLFDRFALGYGTGLRLKMNKETRTNICVDIGFGQNGSGGVYFGLQEAF